MLRSQSHTTAPAIKRTVDLPSAGTLAFTPVANLPTKDILFTTPAINAPVTDTPRYSKRKRSQVTYNEIDENEFLLASDAEEEYEPKAKVWHQGKDMYYPY